MLLVTTSLEDSWAEEKEKILFAGEWCKLYSKHDKLESLDYETFPYHWIDRKKLVDDIEKLELIYEEYLEILSLELNRIHKQNFSTKYWRIIIGPWLQDFIELTFNYYETIKNISKSDYKVSTNIIQTKWEEQVPQDITVFQESYSKAWYNHFLFSEIIKHESSIDYTHINKEHPKLTNYITTTAAKTVTTKIKRLIKYSLSYWYSNFTPRKKRELAFIASYFGDTDLKQIQEQLNQTPMKYLFDPIAPIASVNKTVRETIKLKNSTVDGFKNLLNELLPKQIPTAYVENYSKYTQISKRFFPNDVKAIFTSNSFYFNEAFKIWAANEIEKNAKLLISQHGIYGTSLWNQTERHQLKISDMFYTWGWNNKNFNTKRMPAAKLNYTNKLLGHNPNGDILIITTADIINYLNIQNPYPLEGHFKDYINELAQLPSYIDNSEIKSLLKYRFYHTTFNRDTWGIRDKFKQENLSQYVDSSNKTFYDRVKEARLSIITYHPATTIIENLSANVPTLIFCNEHYWERRKEAEPYFDALASVGIFHTSKESLVKHLKSVYNNTEDWWYSQEVQEAVKVFCDEFAYTSDSCVDEWVEEFKQYI